MNLDNPIYNLKSKYQELTPIPGFSGYFINVLNDVVSFRTAKRVGCIIGPHRTIYPNGSMSSEKMHLTNDDGKRVLRGRKKLLRSTLGEKEFLTREINRANREEFNAKVYAEHLAEFQAARYKKVAEETAQFQLELLRESLGDLY